MKQIVIKQSHYIGILLICIINVFVIFVLLKIGLNDTKTNSHPINQILIVQHSSDSIRIVMLDTTENLLYSARIESTMTEKWLKVPGCWQK